MPTHHIEPYDIFWRMHLNGCCDFAGTVPATSDLDNTYSFNFTGIQTWVRLATYIDAQISYPGCIYNDINYLLMYDDTHFFSIDFDSSNELGYPYFSVEELHPSSNLTYFRLEGPREEVANVFRVVRAGDSRYITFDIFFTDINNQDVKFPCTICSCGSYTCSGTSCTAQSSCTGKPCGGVCKGTCPSGQSCVQDSSGLWNCAPVSPCGRCAPGESCNPQPDGTYKCEPINCIGSCTGPCVGVCPPGQTCSQVAPGVHTCVAIEPPLYEEWWFWLSIFGGLLIFLILLGLIILVAKRNTYDYSNPYY